MLEGGLNSRLQPATSFLVVRQEEALGTESCITDNSSPFCFDHWEAQRQIIYGVCPTLCSSSKQLELKGDGSFRFATQPD